MRMSYRDDFRMHREVRGRPLLRRRGRPRCSRLRVLLRGRNPRRGGAAGLGCCGAKLGREGGPEAACERPARLCRGATLHETLGASLMHPDIVRYRSCCFAHPDQTISDSDTVVAA